MDDEFTCMSCYQFIDVFEILTSRVTNVEVIVDTFEPIDSRWATQQPGNV
jgi:hypothetical protein